MKPCHERPRGHPLLRYTALYATLLMLCLLALSVSGCEGRQPAAVTVGAPPAKPAPPQMAARQAYRNVPLLGELDRAEFDRTMLALTAWVAPQAGCSHCHVEGDAASDAKPAKATARRMLQMVQHLNNNWKPHVGRDGVTCQTCHQGQPQPARGEGDAFAAAVSVDTAQAVAVAAAGARMLNDINGHFLAGGAPAACGSCHPAGGPATLARSEPARHHPALMLLPTETAAAPVVAVRGGPDTCAQAAVAAVKAGARLALAQALRPVVGGGLLPLFSAPDAGCAMLELQLQASDTVEAFVVHAGYTSVRYRRAATGSEARGWVRNERLGPPMPGTAPSTLAALADARPAGLQSAALSVAAPAGCSPAPAQAAAHETLRGRARVLGQGRLQFFAVPDAGCPLRGIFILPGEPVETLQRAPGFIAVAYVNPRTGGRATGWVSAARVGLANDAPATLLR